MNCFLSLVAGRVLQLREEICNISKKKKFPIAVLARELCKGRKKGEGVRKKKEGGRIFLFILALLPLTAQFDPTAIATKRDLQFSLGHMVTKKRRQMLVLLQLNLSTASSFLASHESHMYKCHLTPKFLEDLNSFTETGNITELLKQSLIHPCGSVDVLLHQMSLLVSFYFVE